MSLKFRARSFSRNRFYSPDTGRFISSDPLGMVDGPNTYGFCKGDPVNGIDPMGTKVFIAGREMKEGWITGELDEELSYVEKQLLFAMQKSSIEYRKGSDKELAQMIHAKFKELAFEVGEPISYLNRAAKKRFLQDAATELQTRINYLEELRERREGSVRGPRQWSNFEKESLKCVAIPGYAQAKAANHLMDTSDKYEAQGINFASAGVMTVLDYTPFYSSIPMAMRGASGLSLDADDMGRLLALHERVFYLSAAVLEVGTVGLSPVDDIGRAGRKGLFDSLRGRSLAALTKQEVGDLGEGIARRLLGENGFSDIISVQNASKNGIDIVARAADGRLVFFEVKSSGIGEIRNLSTRQKSMTNFIEDVLGQASTGTGRYRNLDAAAQDTARKLLREFRGNPL